MYASRKTKKTFFNQYLTSSHKWHDHVSESGVHGDINICLRHNPTSKLLMTVIGNNVTRQNNVRTVCFCKCCVLYLANIYLYSKS